MQERKAANAAIFAKIGQCRAGLLTDALALPII
jgi:hypothetical protein